MYIIGYISSNIKDDKFNNVVVHFNNNKSHHTDAYTQK